MQPLYLVLILFILRYYFIVNMRVVLYSFYCKITSLLDKFIDDNEPSIEDCLSQSRCSSHQIVPLYPLSQMYDSIRESITLRKRNMRVSMLKKSVGSSE